MGTWGAGPFDNDSAEELIASLTASDRPERAAALERLLAESVDQGEDADPSEVVAAATVVAVNLGVGDLTGAYPELAEWLEPGSALRLKAHAAEAIQVCLPEEGWFWRSWTDESDRVAARTLVGRLTTVLGAAA